MDNDLFLKKFQGRSETIGREGILGIMNNVHISVNDKQNRKQADSRAISFDKVNKKQKLKKREFDYEIHEIQKNSNKYKPKSQSLALSIKLNNKIQKQKNKINISENIINTKKIVQKDNNLKENKIIKLKYVHGMNDNTNTNEKNKPIKLFRSNTMNNKSKSIEKKQPENIINQNQKILKKQNSIKLPKISHSVNGAKTPKINNKILGKINSKSVRKTFDNSKMNNVNPNNVKSYKIQQTFENKIKLPKITTQKQIMQKSNKELFKDNRMKTVNLKLNYDNY